MRVCISAVAEQDLDTPLPNPPFVEVETFADLLGLVEKYGASVIVGTQTLEGPAPWINIYNGYVE
jgi:hypothetical protein